MNENIKEIRNKKNDYYTTLYINTSDNIKKEMLTRTKCPKHQLGEYLTKDNEFMFRMGTVEDDVLIDIICLFKKICNSVSEEECLRDILTNNGTDKIPADTHEMVKTLIPNILDDYDEEVEWFVSLLIINLGGFITSPLFCYTSFEEDIANGECVMIITPREE